MSAFYRAVNWNRQKLIYDGLLATAVVLYLALYLGITFVVRPEATLETGLIRGLGTAALLLLTLILSIGPLARLDQRFAPLLYNRRHLGVTMFALGLGHAAFALVQFHALGDTNPFVSLLTAPASPLRVARFPFELLGLAALIILFLMAATSHDFWLANLSPPVWKRLHMLVYFAYALLVLHVALGTLQAQTSVIPALLLGLGLAGVLGLHLTAAWRERGPDRYRGSPGPDGYVDVGPVDQIPEGRGKVALVGGERVAVFRYQGRISCLSNVCQHQNGPLGEGRIVDGCITCPWHGYQYRPDTGTSPPPFTEKIPTFNLKVHDGRVFVHPTPNPPGTPVEPALLLADPATELRDEGFYVGYHPVAPIRYARFTRRIAAAILVATAAVAVALAASQEPFGRGVFEYGQTRELSGTLVERPYPMLLLPRPGLTGRSTAYSRYLLVTRGKHGAQSLAADHQGHETEVRGTLISREGTTMVEVAPGGIVDLSPIGAGPGIEPPLELGQRTLTGEVVDSKCWLGVMKPATGTVHRGCAARCLSGGIPPLLIVDDPAAPERQVLLTDASGGPASKWLWRYVGSRVQVTGLLLQEGDLRVMRVATVGR